jgi:hypothetical protein
MTDTAEHLETWLPKEKPCSGCSRWFPLEAFPLNRRMHLGRGSRCRECAREATRDWRKRNREYELAYNAERRERYRAEHPLTEWHCVVCGEAFAGRADRLVCSERCRNRRKRVQREART